ncbi:MAG: DUF1343 domain-containing protein [Actinobacteria bacterium]|nr:DUF1343 domain-containing protein [Actinomycetota bacterium]
MIAPTTAGLDEFLDRQPGHRRLGWLANAGAVERRALRFGPEEALRRGHQVVRLFAPEHGVHGVAQAGTAVAHGRDPLTGLPVWSLYAAGDGDSNAPEAFEGIDAVVVDLLDLGARYGTYAATASRFLECVARDRPELEVLVLDRPNPLGRAIEGPLLEPGFESLVGLGPLPIRHGLTLGEVLRWHVRRRRLDVALEVVPARGWHPGRVSPPRPFIPPSPNLNVFEAQLLYPGSCLFEGTNLSEGRGTATPFQLFGAPWLDSGRLLDRLEGEAPGVAFRRILFRPQSSKHEGEVCEGLFMHVLDPDGVQPVALGCLLLAAVFAEFAEAELLMPSRPEGRRFLDLLWGSTELGDRLAARRSAPTPEPMAGFHASIADDLLYAAV